MMIPNDDAKLAQRRRGSVVAISLRLCAAAVFLILFCVLPARGQATYSDTWDDASGPNDIYLRGCGVTDGSYTHSYYVDSALRSPIGRTDYRSSGRRTGYARADISLPWEWNEGEIGDFITDSEHFARCPYDELYYYSIGSTFNALPVGIARDAYQFLSETFVGGRFGNGVCDVTPTCRGRCTLDSYGVDKVHQLNCPAYFQCRTLTVFGNCVQITKFCIGQSFPGNCN